MKFMQDEDGGIMPLTRTVQSNEGTTQQWQVDPKDIRKFVEENLRGIRSVEFKEYAVYDKNKEENVYVFYSQNDKEAEGIYAEYLQKNLIFSKDFPVYATGNKKKETVTIRKPLVNEIGAYHILSIIEGVFSRIGYMSNLSDNEINDILYEDVLVNLTLTIMENHNDYGIEKGSRDEIIGFVISTCMLILKSSRKGWTGNRFAGTVSETIITKPEKKGLVRSIIGG